MREELKRMGYSVTRYTYPVGTRFLPHTHAVDKIDCVLAGRFELEMAGERIVLEAGECVAVPRDTVHAARVVGNEPVVSLDAVRKAQNP